MASRNLIAEAWDRIDGDIVHPLDLTDELAAARGKVGKASDAVINTILAIAGTATFFWFLAFVLVVWPGAMTVGFLTFDPYPFSFLFFILGGIMQSLFVPAVMISQKRQEQRDAIKSETDHQAALALRKINDTQLEILQRLDAVAPKS